MIVAGAFANPEIAGDGQYLPVGELLSYDDIVAALNSQGHAYTFNEVPREVFADFFRWRLRRRCKHRDHEEEEEQRAPDVAARLAGVPVDGVRFLTYIFCALLAAIAGYLLSCVAGIVAAKGTVRLWVSPRV